MSTESSSEDPEPSPGGIDILQGVPHGYILSGRQSAEYLEAVRPYAEIGARVAVLATDAFVVTGQPSDAWEHQKFDSGKAIVGRLAVAEYFKVVYLGDEHDQSVSVPGVKVLADDTTEYFVAAEDSDSMTLVDAEASVSDLSANHLP